jgi:hypothetical protein
MRKESFVLTARNAGHVNGTGSSVRTSLTRGVTCFSLGEQELETCQHTDKTHTIRKGTMELYSHQGNAEVDLEKEVLTPPAHCMK